MAESDLIISKVGNLDGVVTLTVVVEDTQVDPDPNPWTGGAPSPTVVSVKLTNTSTQRGRVRWQSPSGRWEENNVLPGENMETRIAPARRQFLWQWYRKASMSWG